MQKVVLITLQAQLVFEIGQLRGALLLAFPDQGAALRQRHMPAPADLAAAAPETPLYSSRHQAWVQVSFTTAQSVAEFISLFLTGAECLHLLERSVPALLPEMPTQ